MFYGNAGFFLSSLCASFPLLAQCHVANGKCTAAHVYAQTSVVTALAQSQQANMGSKSKGEETWKISFQSLAKFWGEEETPGKV